MYCAITGKILFSSIIGVFLRSTPLRVISRCVNLTLPSRKRLSQQQNLNMRKLYPIALRCLEPNQAKELVLSENKLQEIPTSLSGLKALRILRLQNNKLKSLPHALGAIITLEDLDCTGNSDLDIVPAAWHSDTAMILWVCRLHKGDNTQNYSTVGCE